MEFSFEKSIVYEDETTFIPEINEGIGVSDSGNIRGKELLELMEAAKENGDM